MERVAIVVEQWTESAACASTDPEVFFPEPNVSVRDAKRICAGCEVQAKCLAIAMEQETDALKARHGIWGGLTPQERSKLARRQRYERSRGAA